MRNGPIKNMNKVHQELNQNRRANAQAKITFGIFSLKKDGACYKDPTLTARTEGEAETLRDRLAGLNPTRTFIIKEI